MKLKLHIPVSIGIDYCILKFNSKLFFFRYAALIKGLLAPEFRYLLNITQYTPNEIFSGPPRNIPTKLVQELFGKLILFLFIFAPKM